MNASVQAITLPGLAIGLLPAVVVVVLLHRWALDARDAGWAIGRMLVQLVLVGYVLASIFAVRDPSLVMLVLCVMLVVATWIALRPLARKSRRLFGYAALGIGAGGLTTLALVVGFVINIEPWFAPRYVIPLGGMTLAAAMNAVSLAAERYESQRDDGVAPLPASSKSLQAALIPVINGLLAVGLVTLPGMMTGQILSGVAPLVAARYQIVVMSMILGASGIAAVVYLVLVRGADGRVTVDSVSDPSR